MSFSKYKNSKCTVDGIVFDSKKEAARYRELKLLQEAGEISDLRRQVKFILIPTQYELLDEIYKKGKHKGERKPGKLLEHEVSYYADFVYKRNGKEVVEDVKGQRTRVYIMKRIMMLWVHGIKIREV